MKIITFEKQPLKGTYEEPKVLGADQLESQGWPEDWPERPVAFPGASMNFVPFRMRSPDPDRFKGVGAPWPEPKTKKAYAPKGAGKQVVPADLFRILLGHTAGDLRSCGLNVDSEVPDHAMLARDQWDPEQLFFEIA